MSISNLVINVNSGSYDADSCADIRAQLEACGLECTRVIRFPDEELPGPGDLDGVDILAVYTGDGTINSAMRKLAGWDGAILALPGGTMNLLSRQLYGERPVEDIVATAPAFKRVRPPIVEGAGIQALVGIIFGPATAWAGVREDMRRADLQGLTDDVPAAFAETAGDEMVGIQGSDARYPAIYLSPAGNQLLVRGFLLDNAAQILRHGFAWLAKDFREGPNERVGKFDEVVIDATGTVGMLFDGEAGETKAGERFRAAEAPVDFLADILGAA